MTYAVQLNPGAANSPLSVSVTGHAITVSLATDGTGALSEHRRQVVAAINADPAASALLWAAHYRGNARRRHRPADRALVHLSDFLWAPQVGDPTQPTGFQVPRVPYQQYVLRICKVCDGSKTGFFVYAQEHAREWVGPLVALETAKRLLKNYGTDPHDDVVRRQPRHLHRPVRQHGRRQLLDAAGRRVRPAPHDDALLRAEQPRRARPATSTRRRSTRPRATAGASTTTAASPSARSSTATRARRRAARATRTPARAS